MFTDTNTDLSSSDPRNNKWKQEKSWMIHFTLGATMIQEASVLRKWNLKHSTYLLACFAWILGGHFRLSKCTSKYCFLPLFKGIPCPLLTTMKNSVVLISKEPFCILGTQIVCAD